MGKLISLEEKREKWTSSYMSPDSRLKISVSSHGRISFQASGAPVVLSFFDSVELLMNLTKDMDYT